MNIYQQLAETDTSKLKEVQNKAKNLSGGSEDSEGSSGGGSTNIESSLEAAQNIPRNEFKIDTILSTVYAVLGLVAVIVIVYNAVAYLSSEGDPSKTKRATQGIVFAAIGLGIILLAAVITNFVFTAVGEAE